MRSVLKEPFVHFVILGALLFMGNALWEQHMSKSDYAISIDPAELERQAVIFASENRRQPTDEDLQALLFAHVEEEVLVREAQKMGLGEDDTIIRRRLAQKMRFLIEDTTAPAPPSETDLKAWYDQNKSQFVEPEKRSFSHIYLSPEKYGDQLQSTANNLLTQTNDDNWKTLGDPFMLNREYGLIEQIAVERLMGTSFANSLFALEGMNWQGPIESAFGLHIVKVHDINSETQPSFDDVRSDVEAAWQESMRRGANNQRLRDLIEKYDVDVENDK